MTLPGHSPVRRRRSVHFVPGGNDRFFAKALASGADTLVLDLEDSVAPSHKRQARTAVQDWLRERNTAPGTQELMVRVNAVDSEWAADDIAMAIEAGAPSLMVPKVSSLADLAALDEMMKVADPSHSVTVMPVATETARAVVELASFATHPRVDALCWGAEDLSVAFGGRAGRDEHNEFLPVYTTVRSLVLIGARAAGVQAIDAVFTDLNDEDGLRREARLAAHMGFDGKITIHPSQIEVVNDCFTPSTDEIDHASRLLAEFEVHDLEGVSAFRFDGQMVDEPHRRRARQVLERAGVEPGAATRTRPETAT